MIYIVRVFAGGHLRLDWGSFWKRDAVAAFFDFEGGLYGDTAVLSVCQKQLFENFE